MARILSPPTILPSRPAVKRDPGLTDMVEELDRFEFKRGALRKQHWDAIQQVVLNCQTDFLYAARNFFWIIQKAGPDQLFDIWPSQLLLYAEMMRLKSMGRQQRILALKARQLGFSLFSEAYCVAWRTMFHQNVDALVVSHSKQHSNQLYSFSMRIYDRLPWWMKPKTASRTLADGIWFENPDESDRRRNPGLNSRIIIQEATQRTDIGQGYTLGALHISEHTSWPQEVAAATIDDEIEYALVDSPDTAAIIEATGEQPGTWGQKFWNKCVENGDDSKWLALFFPWFMEPTRILAPPGGWHPKRPEQEMRAMVAENWVRCSKCGHWSRSRRRKLSVEGLGCSRCDGVFERHSLGDGQLCWMERERLNAGDDEMRIARLRKNLCTTPEEAWTLSGDKAFPQDVIDYVSVCANLQFPIYTGRLDERGNFHAVRSASDTSCYQDWCTQNHLYDEDLVIEIWELPLAGQRYAIGIDGALGYGGEHDYTVIWINRIGARGNPDVQVAMFRSNTIEPYGAASIANFLGRWYNEASIACEYNQAQTIADNLLNYFQYPDLYRWRLDDTVNGGASNRMHWVTNSKTKPKLKDTGIRHLRQRIFFPRSTVFSAELRTVRRLSVDGAEWGSPSGFHDDTVMAALICLHCSHQTDFAESPEIVPPVAADMSPENAPWKLTCNRCQHEWGQADFKDHGRNNCPKCGFMYLKAQRNHQKNIMVVMPDFDGLTTPRSDASGGYPAHYDCL